MGWVTHTASHIISHESFPPSWISRLKTFFAAASFYIKMIYQRIKIRPSKQKVLNNLNAGLCLPRLQTQRGKEKRSMLIIYLSAHSAQPPTGCKHSFGGHGNQGRWGPLYQRRNCAQVCLLLQTHSWENHRKSPTFPSERAKQVTTAQKGLLSKNSSHQEAL